MGHGGAWLVHVYRSSAERRRLGDVRQPALCTLTPNPINEDPRSQGSVFASVAISSGVSLTVQHTQTKLYQGISRDRSGLLASVH